MPWNLQAIILPSFTEIFMAMVFFAVAMVVAKGLR